MPSTVLSPGHSMASKNHYSSCLVELTVQQEHNSAVIMPTSEKWPLWFVLQGARPCVVL